MGSWPKPTTKRLRDNCSEPFACAQLRRTIAVLTDPMYIVGQLKPLSSLLAIGRWFLSADFLALFLGNLFLGGLFLG